MDVVHALGRKYATEVLPSLLRQRALDRIEWHKRSGAEKARRIAERYPLDRYTTIYAYGDTSEDREMLSLAHKKYYRWQEEL